MKLIIEHMYQLLFLMGLILIGLAVFLKIKKVKKKKNEEKTDRIIDQMSIRRASINTGYIEKKFFEICEKTVSSIYTQNIFSIPKQDMVPNLYEEYCNNLKREYDLGIKKVVNEFRIESAKVVKQENSSMYAVTHIIVEVVVFVDFSLYHSSGNRRYIWRFSQMFIFLNANNAWLLESVEKEEYLRNEDFFLPDK